MLDYLKWGAFGSLSFPWLKNVSNLKPSAEMRTSLLAGDSTGLECGVMPWMTGEWKWISKTETRKTNWTAIALKINHIFVWFKFYLHEVFCVRQFMTPHRNLGNKQTTVPCSSLIGTLELHSSDTFDFHLSRNSIYLIPWILKSKFHLPFNSVILFKLKSFRFREREFAMLNQRLVEKGVKEKYAFQVFNCSYSVIWVTDRQSLSSPNLSLSLWNFSNSLFLLVIRCLNLRSCSFFS